MTATRLPLHAETAPARSAAARTDRTPVTPRRAALIAGASYVALFLLAVLANFVVLEGLVVDGDPTATAGNIAASPGLFRLGIASFLVIVALDVVIAWALHVLLGRDAPQRSLLAAWFRVLHSVFLGAGLAFLRQVDLLINGGDHFAPAGRAIAESQALLALETFDVLWYLGLAAFGLHLLLLAPLVVRSGSAPRVLGVLLGLAGAAYVVDTFAYTLLGDYDAVASVMLAVVALPSVVGEGWLGLWLLTRGGRGRLPQPPAT